ncbi:MAG: LysR family transcriptional regulator [Burkholderia sp.]|nr:LysR family transcriptional regulator [Burkholderia sp.]
MIVYAWEFKKGKRELHVRVEGQLVFNSPIQILNATLAGLGLAFTLEDRVREHIAQGRLKRVLDDRCPAFAGYHRYYPSSRQSSPAFSLLVDALRYRT